MTQENDCRDLAAELLCLHPSTLRAKMRKLGIRIRRVAE